jgi:hypothetical protein
MIVAAVRVEIDRLPAGIDGIVPSLQLQSKPAQQLLCLRIGAARRCGWPQKLERVVGTALLQIVHHIRTARRRESRQLERYPQNDEQ